MIGLTEQFLQEHPKIDKAIKRLRGFMPPPPDQYYVAFSGGKDSQCIYHCAKWLAYRLMRTIE